MTNRLDDGHTTANKPLRDIIFGTIETFIAKENCQVMYVKMKSGYQKSRERPANECIKNTWTQLQSIDSSSCVSISLHKLISKLSKVRMIADAKKYISKYHITTKANPNLCPHRADKLNPPTFSIQWSNKEKNLSPFTCPLSFLYKHRRPNAWNEEQAQFRCDLKVKRFGTEITLPTGTVFKFQPNVTFKLKQNKNAERLLTLECCPSIVVHVLLERPNVEFKLEGTNGLAAGFGTNWFLSRKKEK